MAESKMPVCLKFYNSQVIAGDEQHKLHTWAILDISVDHYSPSTMQVMYWFIILNMKLTLNHAVVDLSHALTRKSIALLPYVRKSAIKHAIKRG